MFGKLFTVTKGHPENKNVHVDIVKRKTLLSSEYEFLEHR